MYPRDSGIDGSFLAQCLPALLFFLVLALVVARLAERKGQPKIVCVVVMLVPFVNVLTLLWLVSLTDSAVLEELADLRVRLNEISPSGGP